jgi:hypothetical protein
MPMFDDQTKLDKIIAGQSGSLHRRKRRLIEDEDDDEHEDEYPNFGV